MCVCMYIRYNPQNPVSATGATWGPAASRKKPGARPNLFGNCCFFRKKCCKLERNFVGEFFGYCIILIILLLAIGIHMHVGIHITATPVSSLQ